MNHHKKANPFRPLLLDLNRKKAKKIAIKAKCKYNLLPSKIPRLISRVSGTFSVKNGRADGMEFVNSGPRNNTYKAQAITALMEPQTKGFQLPFAIMAATE